MTRDQRVWQAHVGALWRKLPQSSVVLWIILLIGFGLRVYQLGFRPLWDDEAFSVLIIAADIQQVALATVKDTFPPLYYYLLSTAMMVMGHSEFAVRYASLAGSFLSIPVVYHLGKRLVNRQVGHWAALVMAFSPFMVYFAQEARAYSWLVLTSLLSVYTFVRVMAALQTGDQASLGRWAAFACASAAMLYTHFLAVWILVVEALYFVVWWWRRRQSFWPWVGAHLMMGVLFSPWILLLLGIGMGTNTHGGSRSYAGPRQLGGLRVDTPLASLLWIWQEGRSTHGAISLLETLRQSLVSFTVGDFISPTLGLGLALGFLFIAMMGLAWLLPWRLRTAGRSDTSTSVFPWLAPFLLLYALLPILLSYFVAFPTSRPHWAKYFMMALPAFTLAVAAGLAALQKRAWFLALLGGSFVVAASTFTLYNYFENPAYARANMRPAVSYLEQFSSPSDALLANPPRSSPPFWYYYHGNLPYYSPVDQTIDVPLLRNIAEKHAGLWVVQNLPVGFDPNQDIERWLTYHTYRTFTNWVGPLIFRYYSMPVESPPSAEETFKPPVGFGESITLHSYRLWARTSGRMQILQIELDWRARASVHQEYMVGAQVLDAEGQVWGLANSAPLGNFQPTSSWEKEQRILDHLGLLLWPGAPPGKYRVRVRLYRESDGSPLPVVQGGIDKPDGQLELAPVDVGWSALLPSVEMLSLDHIVNQDLDGLRLLGCQVSGMQVKPGESLKSTLFWKASQAGPPEHQGILWLEDRGGQRWAETTAPAGGGYPTSQWPAGQVVRDPRGLSLPSDMPDGPYALKLQVADASGKVYGPAVTLTTLKVQGRDKQFAMPRIGHPQRANLGSQVELLGYDLPSARVSPGGELSFTLYWRALSSMDTSFTVFNHLVGPDDGLAGQRDSVPVGGSLPTTQWVKGEIIADTYHLPVKTGASPGTYRLFTGLYNPATGDRLPVAGAEGSSPAADHVVLDTEIEVR